MNNDNWWEDYEQNQDKYNSNTYLLLVPKGYSKVQISFSSLLKFRSGLQVFLSRHHSFMSPIYSYIESFQGLNFIILSNTQVLWYLIAMSILLHEWSQSTCVNWNRWWERCSTYLSTPQSVNHCFILGTTTSNLNGPTMFAVYLKKHINLYFNPDSLPVNTTDNLIWPPAPLLCFFPLMAPTNNLVSLRLQLMKATVLSESSLYFIFSHSSLVFYIFYHFTFQGFPFILISDHSFSLYGLINLFLVS